MNRRACMISFAHAALASTLATTLGPGSPQRPANPIARPPRPGGVFGPGRFPAVADGPNRTPPPGLFVVKTINVRENVVQLSDGNGRTARVFVDPALFDLREIRSGDEVLVDFIAPTSANAPLRAAGMWLK